MFANSSRFADQSEPPNRFATWAIICAVLCPAACVGLFMLGGYVWERMSPLSASLTVTAFKHFEGSITMARGELVEAINLVLTTLFAALFPAVAIGVFKPSWGGRIKTAAALFPAWIIVMAAPTMIIYEYAQRVDPNIQKASLACNFLFAFTAVATTVALAYSLWIRLHPETYSLRGAR